jgi:protein TonB
MTLQAKAFQFSFFIHALLVLGVFILSRNISTQVKTVLIDFSLACGSGGPGPPGPSLLRSGAANGMPAKIGVEKSEVRARRSKSEPKRKKKAEPIAVPKPRVEPKPTPGSSTLATKDPSPPKVSVPLNKIEEKPAPQPEVKSPVPTAPVDTNQESNDELATPDKQSEKEAATRAALEAMPAETDEEHGSSGYVHGLPAQSASASGSGTGLHSGGTAGNKYLRRHFAYIRNMIMSKLRYPAIARQKGWSGRLKISFLVGEDGSVNDVKIIASSGFSVLDKNAIDAVKEIAPLPTPPVRAEIIMPITYRLK